MPSSSSVRAAFTAAIATLAILGAATVAADEAAIAVIVHPSRTAVLERDDVARIFLRKRRFWDDGAAIVPVNPAPQSAVRVTFTRRVLAPAVGDLQRYWNEEYFHGVFPPPVLASAAAVKRYVAVNRDAIGYVAASELDDTVRVVLRIE